MYCGGCVANVKQRLSDIAGVMKIIVNLGNKEVCNTSSPNVTIDRF